MNITHLCLAGTITDGWSYQENILSKYHQLSGNQVTIITSIWVYDQKYQLYRYSNNDYYLDNGIHVIRLEMFNGCRPNGRFARFKGVKAALDTSSPDILFIHGCQFLDMNKVVTYLKTHSGVTVYVDNHADFSNSAKNLISRIINQRLWRHCLHLVEPYTKKFYGVLPARCTFLRDIYGAPAEKVELLVMGADDELVERAFSQQGETRQKYQIDPNDFIIVTGGKIDKFKTQTLLLMQAVRCLNNPKVKLIVFGPVDEELKSSVEKMADGERIKYIGWLNSEESYNLFAISNLVVFPGRHSVYWEQVAGMGIPMVVKSWEGTHHIDKNGNVLFLKKDSEKEIEEIIQGIVSNEKKYYEMLSAAKRAREDFSYRELAKRCIE